MTEYGIYNEKDLIAKEELEANCEWLRVTADEWNEIATKITTEIYDFKDENISIEGKNPIENYTELVNKMRGFATELKEYANALSTRVSTIYDEQKAEIERHKKEEEERKKAAEEYEQWKKDNQYTDTVDPGIAYSSSSSNNTVSNSVTNTVSNTVVY